MDFGKSENIDELDLSLPQDHPGNLSFLNKLNKSGTARFYVGCAKWGRKDWIGKIYPEGTKEIDFLEHYGRHFNSIELNATFYKLPDPNSISKWNSRIKGDFKFCPKFSDIISHKKRLKDCEEITSVFLNSVSYFGNHLGPVFLQLPPNFTPKNLDVLSRFLKQLPTDHQFCVELRHPLWFSDESIFNETFDMMEELGIGSVITDAAGRRDCVHQRLTNSVAFIRFVGNNLHPTDYSRVVDWVIRIKEWVKKGVDEVYFFIHQHDEQYTPELIRYTVEAFNKECKANLEEVKLLNED